MLVMVHFPFFVSDDLNPVVIPFRRAALMFTFYPLGRHGREVCAIVLNSSFLRPPGQILSSSLVLIFFFTEAYLRFRSLLSFLSRIPFLLIERMCG